MEKKRKRRSDRTHLIYQITNQQTGDFYIGITVVTGKAYNRSLNERWKRHVSRATYENKIWAMCEAIRTYGPQSFERKIIEKIRGKAQAHQRETELIKALNPTLNTSSTQKQ